MNPTREYVQNSTPADLAAYSRRAAQSMRARGVKIDQDPANGRPIGDGAGGGVFIRYDRDGARITYQRTSRSKERTLTSFTDADQAAAFFERVARHIRDSIHRDRLAADPDAIAERRQRLAAEHRTTGTHNPATYPRHDCPDCDAAQVRAWTA